MTLDSKKVDLKKKQQHTAFLSLKCVENSMQAHASANREDHNAMDIENFHEQHYMAGMQKRRIQRCLEREDTTSMDVNLHMIFTRACRLCNPEVT